jgi:hypothetical protein
MHGREALPGRFFFTADCAAMCSHDRAVEAPQFFIEQICGDSHTLQSVKDLIQRTAVVPFVKVSPDSLISSELFRKIASLSPCPQNPKNAIKYRARIRRRTARFLWLWKQISDQLPFFIRQQQT